MALQMMAGAWSPLKHSIISNCFRLSGLENTQAATSSTKAENELLIASRWMTLKDKGIVAADVLLNDFVNVDTNVEGYVELTDSQINESTQKHDDNVSSLGEDDDLQDTQTPVTALKVMDVLAMDALADAVASFHQPTHRRCLPHSVSRLRWGPRRCPRNA